MYKCLYLCLWFIHNVQNDTIIIVIKLIIVLLDGHLNSSIQLTDIIIIYLVIYQSKLKTLCSSLKCRFCPECSKGVGWSVGIKGKGKKKEGRIEDEKMEMKE